MLQKNGPISKNQLMAATGYKLTTLSRFLRPLEERALVVRPQMGASSGGRRPVLYDVNDHGYYLLGVDVSRTYLQVVLTDLKLRVVEERRFEMDAASTPEWTVRAVADTAASLLQEGDARGGRLLLAGVGAVGPMSRAQGLLHAPAYFEAPGWDRDVPLVPMLEQALGCTVSLDNGANAAVLAESLYGIGVGVPRVVYVNCGMGVRTGTFLDGSLIRTPQNEEDVFGHMVVDADGLPCGCGKRGCLDCYASARAAAHAFEARRRAGEASALPAEADWQAVCAGADAGDALASDVIGRAGWYLGVGLSNLINLLSPGLVVLSGPLIRSSALYYETAARTAREQAWAAQSGVVFHRGGRLGGDAMAIGAAALALEEAVGTLPGLRQAG